MNADKATTDWQYQKFGVFDPILTPTLPVCVIEALLVEVAGISIGGAPYKPTGTVFVTLNTMLAVGAAWVVKLRK